MKQRRRLITFGIFGLLALLGLAALLHPQHATANEDFRGASYVIT